MRKTRYSSLLLAVLGTGLAGIAPAQESDDTVSVLPNSQTSKSLAEIEAAGGFESRVAARKHAIAVWRSGRFDWCTVDAKTADIPAEAWDDPTHAFWNRGDHWYALWLSDYVRAVESTPGGTATQLRQAASLWHHEIAVRILDLDAALPLFLFHILKKYDWFTEKYRLMSPELDEFSREFRLLAENLPGVFCYDPTWGYEHLAVLRLQEFDDAPKPRQMLRDSSDYGNTVRQFYKL